MKFQPKSWRWAAAVVCGVCLFSFAASITRAAELKLEAVLIWGTNDTNSPDPNHKLVGPKLAKTLGDLPIKWKSYFVVEKKDFSVNQGATEKVRLSKECEIKVKNADGASVELQLIGKGKPVGKMTKDVNKGCLVTGGNAENFTSWFVVLRKKE
ncbi:MAG: hypothetical protein EPO07_15400 [Verrucomicrobia bacterium]|nr:MAG: hypothetical protein EPO07_15400 [Verrucomicrobiota bacterium]